MRNFNVVVLEGRLVKDPEIRYTQNGTPLCSFSIANNYSYYRGDELQEEVNFIDITTWSRLAEQCNEYLKKGRHVIVNGRLKQNRWQDDNGNTHSKIGLVCNQVQFLDFKTGEDASNSDSLSDEDAPL